MVNFESRPAFSEEFEKAEEELQKLYGEYLTHVRCLDALRSQMNINAKLAQPISEERKSSAPASMILLPDGILDFSDELSNDGDDLLDDEGHDLKLKRPLETTHDGSEIKTDKHAESDGARAKLRIKTGGEFFFSSKQFNWKRENSIKNHISSSSIGR